MTLWIERLYPYVGGIIAAWVWWGVDAALPDPRGPLLSSSLTLGAILTGFLATAKAILISLRGSAIMNELRESTYIHDLVSYLAQAIWTAFAFSILALLGFFDNTVAPYYDLAWIGLGVVAALSFVRVTYILLKLIQHERAA